MLWKKKGEGLFEGPPMSIHTTHWFKDFAEGMRARYSIVEYMRVAFRQLRKKWSKD